MLIPVKVWPLLLPPLDDVPVLELELAEDDEVALLPLPLEDELLSPPLLAFFEPLLVSFRLTLMLAETVPLLEDVSVELPEEESSEELSEVVVVVVVSSPSSSSSQSSSSSSPSSSSSQSASSSSSSSASHSSSSSPLSELDVLVVVPLDEPEELLLLDEVLALLSDLASETSTAVPCSPL